jgi:hypothetical protein
MNGQLRAIRLTRCLAFTAVVIAFGLACHQMYEERHVSGWRVPLNRLSGIAHYVVGTAESGRVHWQAMIMAMLAWISATVAEKYLGTGQPVDSIAEDYK